MPVRMRYIMRYRVVLAYLLYFTRPVGLVYYVLSSAQCGPCLTGFIRRMVPRIGSPCSTIARPVRVFFNHLTTFWRFLIIFCFFDFWRWDVDFFFIFPTTKMVGLSKFCLISISSFSPVHSHDSHSPFSVLHISCHCWSFTWYSTHNLTNLTKKICQIKSGVLYRI
jgi:hypothetical protein